MKNSNQSLIRVTDSDTEPVTTPEAKTHLRVDISDDDSYIDTLITAARQYVEQVTRRSLYTQTWRVNLRHWPGGNFIKLPMAVPLQSVTHVKHFNESDVESTFNSSNYFVDTDSKPGRVWLKDGQNWPSDSLREYNPIQITYIAGESSVGDIEQLYKNLILLLVAHWYENREPVIVGTSAQNLPLAIESLIMVNRIFD